jgi:Meckel syndrome type 1 protein
LLLAGAAGGFYVLHGHSGSSSKRLPGMGQMADMLPFAKAEKHPSKAVLPASATLAAQQVKPADPALASLGQTASAPVAGLAQPVEPGAERLPPVAGLDEPSASAAPAAIAPTAAAASSAERGAIPTLDSDGIVYLDEHKKVAGVILGNKDRDGLTDPGDADDYASGAGSGNGDVRILQRALARLQDKVATLEARMPDAGAATRVSGASANTDSSLRQTQRAKRERLARDRRWAEREYAAHVAAQAAIAAASASAPAPAPTLGAQLLSVDMWGGTPSVVVTSGLPDDKRIRTLRPGDTLNGVTLQSADPATGSATFSSDGKSFTLSTRTGG